MIERDGALIGRLAANRLAALRVADISPGLTDDEIAGLETEFGFSFAADHRGFLSAGVPTGGPWPDWRHEGRRSLTKRLQLPVEGVLFAVEHREFWPASWGPRPAATKFAVRSARYHLSRVPQLLPVHSNQYLPAGRGSFGHPVLSVAQTTVAACAADLSDYVERDFGSGATGLVNATPTVEFWSTLVS